MVKIAITGSKGIIGSILKEGLCKYKISELDLPEIDVRDYNQVLKAFDNQEIIIHLAWDTRIDNRRICRLESGNTKMFENVYRAALEKNVRRVIVASSVHADNYLDWKKSQLISVERNPQPSNPYGAHKIFMEKVGQWYSTKGLEVVCIRLGGVWPKNKPWMHDLNIVGLSHPDCIKAFEKVIEAKKVPNNYSVFYCVSDNQKRVHNISNPFGWRPSMDAAHFYKKLD